MNNIFLCGHKGMVGSALMKKIQPSIVVEKNELDLERQSDVERFFEIHKPKKVIIAAARVGGIQANNTYRAEFIYKNLQIQNNVIHTSYLYGVEKLLFLGSSCIYPKKCKQPMKEEYLLSSYLEYTNEPYAIAKIAGIKMCESYYKQYGCNFISVMPTNLYGVNDRYDENSHVIPALIKKFHEAKINKQDSVTIWGTGKAKREFMYVDDLADACDLIFDNVEAKDIYENNISHINIGTSEEIKISTLAKKIKKIVGFKGKIIFDTNKPDGHLRKLLDTSRLKNLGYKPNTDLEFGLQKTYEDYKIKIK